MKLRKTPITAGVCLSLAAMLSASCGKKKSDDSTESSDETVTDEGSPSVSTNSDNNLLVSGQLAISTMSLTETTKGVLAFSSRNGEMRASPQVISVDAAGNFEVPIKRSEDGIKIIAEEASKSRDERNWERMYQGLTDAFPEMVSSFTLEKLKAKSEDEIQEGVGDLAKMAAKTGPVTMLVAYDKTGDKISEAASFRFISLPTPENKALSAIPNERLKGDVSLGKITGSDRDVISQIKSKDALNLSDSALESLADAGRALKNVINDYMNDNWKAQPFYFWQTTQHKEDAVDVFSSPSATKYHGYGFYIGSDGDQGLTYDAVCGTKSITFTPPEPITVSDPVQGNATVAAYDNTATTASTQGGSRICSNGGGYYAREDVRNGEYSFMLNFGTGGSITSNPKGLWRMKVDNSEVARFDFDTSTPVVDDHPVVPIPSVKFTTSGGEITGVEVELYRWDGTSFVKIEDLSGFSRIVTTLRAGYSSVSDNGDYETKLVIGDDNKITGLFDSSESSYGGGTRNPPTTLANVKSFAVYYVIGNASYRLELR